MTSQKRDRPYLTLLAVVIAGVGLHAIIDRFLRSRPEPEPLAEPIAGHPLAPLDEDIGGLTEAEVEANRALGQNTALRPTPRRTPEQIIRDSTLTIFNLNLAVLTVVMMVLGRPLDALITLGVMAANIAANLFQEEFTRRRLRRVEALAGAKTTVIRDDTVQSIDPEEIVVGDVLAVAVGDQLIADGRVIGEGTIVVDESAITGDSSNAQKSRGDTVFAGSACGQGRAFYRAEKVGDERLVVGQLRTKTDDSKQMTPIERILNRIMRVLLVFVFLFGIILVSAYYLQSLSIAPERFADYVSIVFSIAPASLFFMVVLTYTAATADLAAKGALVHQSRSVETLAQADVICFAKEGILTGAAIELLPIADDPDSGPLSRTRIRQVLGDYAANTSTSNLVTKALVETFPGTKRTVVEEAPFLSVYGWSALAFDDNDLRGVFVIAEPELLDLDQQDAESTADVDLSPIPPRERVLSVPRSFGRLFRRDVSQDGSGDSAPEQAQQSDAIIIEASIGVEQNGSTGLFGRLRRRVDSMLDLVEVEPDLQVSEDNGELDDDLLVFAYSPFVYTLHSEDREPHLPDGLIPLCYLDYREEIRPEADNVIQDFVARGVDIKIFTPEPPQKTVEMIINAGLEVEQAQQLRTITGSEVQGISSEGLMKAAKENTVFGQFSLQQMVQIVQSLREDGRLVALIGDRVGDMAAMRQADLSIARRSSYPAVFNTADIVLLDDSPSVLSAVVDRGQRIVNGLLDILKLNLTQVFYLLILIVTIPLISEGFPYTSAEAGLVAFFTITVPALGLALWADAGSPLTRDLNWLLARFIGPAALTMAITALIVYILFYSRSANIAYAQIGLTHVLVSMGLLLVLFIKPPFHYRTWKTFLPGDLRPTLLVGVEATLFLAATYMPFTQELLKVEHLQQPSHYLIIVVATLAWGITLQFLLKIIPIGQRVIFRTNEGP